jgi:hypothetical protein
MKTALRLVALVTALFFAAASAQSDLIGAYRSMLGSLEGARVTLRQDPAAALARVREAENTFRRIQPPLSAALSSGASAALKNAQVAVSRSSNADFTAQSGQIKAILERAMFETYFNVFSNTPQAGRYAATLGDAFRLTPAQRADLSASTRAKNANRARAILETQLAQIIGNALNTARDNAGNRALAFSSISRAANHFLIVQDSPRVGNITVASFTDAIATLAANDTRGFQQAVSSLGTQVRGFAGRARALVASNRNPSANPAPRPASPPAASNPAPAARPAATAVPASSSVNGINVAPIRATLVRGGIAAATADGLAARLARAGYASVGDAIDAVSGRLSSALANLQDTNIPDGRAQITAALTTYNTTLRPIVDAADAGLGARVSRVFEATNDAFGVRPVDVTVLLGEMETIRHWSDGKPMSALQATVANIQPVWMGWVRGIAFLAVALLFIYPIYLLNLAFGGRNPYWRYIGIAMVLLFVPPLIEGLAWLGTLLAEVTGLRFLDALTGLSVLQNPLAQIVWVLILIATVIFATLGFRGIAAQFGLIRTRDSAAGRNPPVSMGTAAFATGRNNTPAERAPMATQQVPATAERTIVEWDEEF